MYLLIYLRERVCDEGRSRQQKRERETLADCTQHRAKHEAQSHDLSLNTVGHLTNRVTQGTPRLSEVSIF